MSESIFATLEQVLLPHESLKFTILRQSQGLVLLAQPVLRKSENVPKEAEQARALLGVQLRLAGTAAELDATFAAKVKGYAEARRELHDSYRTLIDALNEASKEARAKTQERGKGGGNTPKSPPAPSTPSAAAPTANTPDAPAAPKAEAESPPRRSVDTGVMQPASLL